MAFIIQNGVLTKYEEEFGINEILIPNYVKSIGDNAFKDCESLEIVNIPYSVEHIPFHAFDGCTNLTKFNIVNSEDEYI